MVSSIFPHIVKIGQHLGKEYLILFKFLFINIKNITKEIAARNLT